VSGDTLATIATKTGTTVAVLLKLNPGIDPTALQVGQKIRVQ
jgi:LysM repeat protein